MPIKKVSECDVCGKTKPTEIAAGSYFIHNIVHVYCSQECYEAEAKEARDEGV